MTTTTTTATATSGVIIVGGGLAGFKVASFLRKKSKEIDITIVDRQDYLDWCLASPRSLVAPDDVEAHSYTMPQSKLAEFVKAKFVQGSVKEIGPTTVQLHDGTTLTGDCVVVAIGGQYAQQKQQDGSSSSSTSSIWKALPEHTTSALRVAAFREQHELVKAAQNIVVVGAGFSGVEIAGEIKAAFPDKTVTLVGTVMGPARDVLKARVTLELEKLGVVLKAGRVERAQQQPDENQQITTTEGDKIDADLVLTATGFVFSADKLMDDSLKQDVTSRGQLDCKPTLQLKNCDTVFAAGDICAVPEGCYAATAGSMHAEETAKIVAANVVKLLSKKGGALQPFKWSTKPIQTPCLTALGPDVGVGDMGLPKFMMGISNAMTRKFKCKDYYMSIQASNFGKGKTW